MRVSDIPEVEGAAAVAPEVAAAQVEVEVVLAAHPTTTVLPLWIRIIL